MYALKSIKYCFSVSFSLFTYDCMEGIYLSGQSSVNQCRYYNKNAFLKAKLTFINSNILPCCCVVVRTVVLMCHKQIFVWFIIQTEVIVYCTNRVNTQEQYNVIMLFSIIWL